MTKSRYTEARIIAILRRAEGGVPVAEAQDHATQWLRTYNSDRPNMSIGGIAPAQQLKMTAQAMPTQAIEN